MKKLVILTGAGMSSESGIKTFRDSGGLWEIGRAHV
jgi:NAD-dependent deacetylase